MTSWEWNVPRLRVKMTFEVGVTYMVRKVFSRAIFWEIFSKIVRLKLEQYQKGSFLTPKIPHISAPNKNFENRALLLFINLPEESLCKKSKKSLEPFSLTASNQPTNRPTNNTGRELNWSWELTNNTGRSSTEVENCNVLESTCSTSESEIIFNLFMLTRYFHNIVQLFEPLSTVNDSIRIKRNDI